MLAYGLLTLFTIGCLLLMRMMFNSMCGTRNRNIQVVLRVTDL